MPAGYNDHSNIPSPLTSTTVLVQKGGVGLCGIVIANLAAATSWLQLFDAAALADVTLGTTKPTITIAVAASVSKEVNLDGMRFKLGLVVASTTTAEGNTTASTNVCIGLY